MPAILKRSIVRDSFIICLGCLVFAVGLDCFELNNGLAAGGATGLAMTIREVVLATTGVALPVGGMVLLMNVFLMVPVVRTGGLRYAARTLVGIVASSVLIDALEPFLPELGNGDLLLCALWGGVICGIGLGLVFRVGGNTGGTDILAQLLPRVFGLERALYAAVAMYISSYAIDRVVDGFNSQRAAYIISDKYEEIAHMVLYELDRGCTELYAKGSYSGKERPVLLVVVNRSMAADLREGVSSIDPDAIVFITEVFEAYGEGFKSLRR